MKNTGRFFLSLLFLATAASAADYAQWPPVLGYNFAGAETITSPYMPVSSLSKAPDFLVNISLDITSYGKYSLEAMDLANNYKLGLLLPSTEAVDDCLWYNADFSYPNGVLQGAISFGNFHWTDCYDLEFRGTPTKLSMKIDPVGSGAIGQLEGEIYYYSPDRVDKVSATISRTGSGTSAVYSFVGEGINLTLNTSGLKGVINRTKYKEWSIAAILSMTLMLKV